MFFCLRSFFPFTLTIFAVVVKPFHSLILFKFFILLIAAILWREPREAAGEDPLFVMFWNLENFFDWKTDPNQPNSSDEEFSSFGKRHWTKKKFIRKCQAISKALFYLSDEHGTLPDVIGLAEVENKAVLTHLLKETNLRFQDYGIVHYDSPDPRGIDVALLYRKQRLKLLDSKPIGVSGDSLRPLLTRDILLATFTIAGGDTVAFLVNHHPSKYGANSSWRRDAAMSVLESVTDSILAAGQKRVVAMGDFNDIPSSAAGYSKKMVNMAAPLAAKGQGTIKYSGRWEMIDMFFISPFLQAHNPGIRMKVERLPFLMVKDNTHSGEKPFRTFTGPRYSGGVSDHCPITLVIQ